MLGRGNFSKSKMVSFCVHSARRVPLNSTLVCRRGFLHQLPAEIPAQCKRLGHSQSLWEELLGRKIEVSAAKKLEDAFLEYKVRKSVPSWLPFLPNCSFWIPSNEQTIRSLQVLAQRLKESHTRSKERPKAGKSTSHWSDNDKNGAVSTMTAWALIHHTDKLLSYVEIPAAEIVTQHSTTTGTITELVLENNDNADGESEVEAEAAAKKKGKGQ